MRHMRSPRSGSFSPRIEPRARSRVASLAGVRRTVRDGAIAPGGRGDALVPSRSRFQGASSQQRDAANKRCFQGVFHRLTLTTAHETMSCVVVGARWRDRATRSRISCGPLLEPVDERSPRPRRLPLTDGRHEVAQCAAWDRRPRSLPGRVGIGSPGPRREARGRVRRSAVAMAVLSQAQPCFQGEPGASAQRNPARG